ncbi:MAG: hypothetical protein Q8Q82_06295 [Hydrogenophaga sp.]|uniref:hypothetical protein n=1 Tax=Hydrogenophaga sp. Root209 TaxID=1736490 RepID=UPI0012E34CE1|nr:hypothetical protein [Hydrogenophaga sp. Root209]MDP3833553.1 hypothetical protein [Hydrogenophaga sp.]
MNQLDCIAISFERDVIKLLDLDFELWSVESRAKSGQQGIAALKEIASRRRASFM